MPETDANRSSPTLTLYEPVGYLFPLIAIFFAAFAWFLSDGVTRYVNPWKSNISNLMGVLFVVCGVWIPFFIAVVSAWVVGRCYLKKVWLLVDQDGITLTEAVRWRVHFYDWKEFEKFSVKTGLKGEKMCWGEFAAGHPEVRRHRRNRKPPAWVGLHIGINYGLKTTDALVDLLNARLAESSRKVT